MKSRLSSKTLLPFNKESCSQNVFSGPTSASEPSNVIRKAREESSSLAKQPKLKCWTLYSVICLCLESFGKCVSLCVWGRWLWTVFISKFLPETGIEWFTPGKKLVTHYLERIHIIISSVVFLLLGNRHFNITAAMT